MFKFELFLHLFFLYASFSVILIILSEVILDRIICSDVLPCTKYWLTHGEAQIFLMPFPLMDGVTMFTVPSNQDIIIRMILVEICISYDLTFNMNQTWCC